MTLILSSPAFDPDSKIPSQFSREGGNVSPPIEWRDAPRETRSFALIVEDSDAPKGTFHHWAAYDIPGDICRLAAGAGSRQHGAAVNMARNDFGNARYDGPEPPLGDGTHHYHFRLFALDVPRLEVPRGCDAEEVLAAAQEHSLAQAAVVGTFESATCER